MSRSPAKTGKAIGFRLPFQEDKLLREAAAKAGISPGEFARRVIQAHISKPIFLG